MASVEFEPRGGFYKERIVTKRDFQAAEYVAEVLGNDRNLPSLLDLCGSFADSPIDISDGWDDRQSELNKDAQELAKLTKEILDYLGELEGDKPSWLETSRYVSIAIAKVQRHAHDGDA